MKKIVMCLAFVFILSMAGEASANHGKGHGMSLEDACYKELVTLLMHAKELKLTDEQLQTLKDRKYEIRRQDIQLDAQMELVKLDIKKQLAGDVPNQTQLDALIDNKIELKRTLNKAFAKTIVDARSLLTPEQRAQFKDIVWSEWSGRFQGKKYCPGKSGK